MKIKIILTLLILFWSANLVSQSKLPKNLIQESSIFETKRNTLSRFDFYTTNYGIHFFNAINSSGGCFWPRGSANQYIFAEGLWFGCKKFNVNSQKDEKMVVINYNPYTGSSWFVPGLISDGDAAIQSLDKKYRNYLSTNFDPISGKTKKTSEGPDWSLWKSNSNGEFNYGNNEYKFVGDELKRNTDNYPEGPLFISSEDIATIYKDTDLSRYEGGIAYRKSQGYPLKIEIQSNILTWYSEKLRDFILLTYVITNKSSDILKNCYIADIVDPDIVYFPNASIGAINDRAKYYTDDTSLNLSVAWTNTDKGEKQLGFGYLGVFLLETPAVDEQGNLRHDKLVYNKDEQLGLTSFRIWSIDNDLKENDERYDFLASSKKDLEAGPSDIRLVFSTGEFNLKPNESAIIKIGITAALPSKGAEADGTKEDMNDLINNVKYYVNQYYLNQFTNVDDERNDSKNKINIFPNPSSNFLRIETEYLENPELVFYNILGNQFTLNWTQRISNNKMIFEINTSELKTNTYFYKITNGTKNFTGKFIKD